MAMINRRTVLRGIGGTVVSLPLLEVMGSEAWAQTASIPKRYFIGFGGISLGRRNSYRDEFTMDKFAPNNTGPGYDLKRAIQPLGDEGVREQVSVVSGLKIPWSDQDGNDATPPGGRTWPGSFHNNSLPALLSGMRTLGLRYPKAITSDQVVANAIAQDTQFKSLAYRAQVSYYRGAGSTSTTAGIMSYKGPERSDRIPPVFSPRQAFDTLFTGFTPADPIEAAQRRYLLDRRKKVVDLVRGSAQRLAARLGQSDKTRMEQHFDEISDLHRRLDAVQEPAGQCQVPTHPGDDPPYGGHASQPEDYTVNTGYSNEDLRASIFTDLIHMAFVCDLSRVASMVYTMSQSFMNAYAIVGAPSDFHELGHGGDTGGKSKIDAMSDCVGWHVKHFAQLVKKLRDTPEGGGSVLDNCALTLCFEGGHGYNPAQAGSYSAHSTENMGVLIAGGAGGLRQGVHVAAGGEYHPAQVLVSAMKAVGVDQDLGEVSGHIPALFS